ncbi:MAG: ParA family protein [Acidobacteria bacterium]|nr:ParA family protein [Acidobacteriota bacterium]
MTRSIAVFNHAGGVGKTTTTRDLGYEMASRGRKVLLIDADPQGSLSDFLGLDPHSRPHQEIFWQALLGETGDATDLPAPPHLESAFGMDIGLANLLVFQMEQRLAEMKNTQRLLDVLESIKDRYDFILIDCPPNVSEITVQVLMAVDEVLIPVQTEHKATIGLVIVQNEILKANQRRRRIRPELQISGIVPTIFSSTKTEHRNYLQAIHDFARQLSRRVLPPVSDRIAVAEASSAGKPLKVYAPNSPANADIEQIANLVFGS